MGLTPHRGGFSQTVRETRFALSLGPMGRRPSKSRPKPDPEIRGFESLKAHYED